MARKDFGRLSRRGFTRALGIGSAAVVAGGSRPLLAGPGLTQSTAAPVLLHNNENPTGPSAAALEGMERALAGGPPAGRYPSTAALRDTIADELGLPTDRIMVGNGSTQLLRTATHVFTSPDRPLVAGELTYEECPAYADVVGHPVVRVPLRSDLALDLDRMAAVARGAGMVFVDNPSNPTGILHPDSSISPFVERTLAGDPEVVVCVDEAYHDYVTAPDYRSLVAEAASRPRLLVSRTFSKAHGMAGMRIGYTVGHPDTLAPMLEWNYRSSMNLPALAGAAASLRDRAGIARERDRNTAARAWTIDWFRSHGYETTDAQTNFVFVETRMEASRFRTGCRARGFLVGRDFPPLAGSHARISIGTLEQMRAAVEAFREVLGIRAVA